jgi:hypothetical protein
MQLQGGFCVSGVWWRGRLGWAVKRVDPRLKHSGMTARQEHSGMTARQERSGMTAPCSSFPHAPDGNPAFSSFDTLLCAGETRGSPTKAPGDDGPTKALGDDGPVFVIPACSWRESSFFVIRHATLRRRNAWIPDKSTRG